MCNFWVSNFVPSFQFWLQKDFFVSQGISIRHGKRTTKKTPKSNTSSCTSSWLPFHDSWLLHPKWETRKEFYHLQIGCVIFTESFLPSILMSKELENSSTSIQGWRLRWENSYARWWCSTRCCDDEGNDKEQTEHNRTGRTRVNTRKLLYDVLGRYTWYVLCTQQPLIRKKVSSLLNTPWNSLHFAILNGINISTVYAEVKEKPVKLHYSRCLSTEVVKWQHLSKSSLNPLCDDDVSDCVTVSRLLPQNMSLWYLCWHTVVVNVLLTHLSIALSLLYDCQRLCLLQSEWTLVDYTRDNNTREKSLVPSSPHFRSGKIIVKAYYSCCCIFFRLRV